MRAGVLPRWAGLLLIVGDSVFGAASFSGAASPIVEVVRTAETVTVTITGSAPGILRGTWSKLSVTAAVPLRGWVPL